ncbi:uncharacterized protein M421DRAFT_385196 [Didymella exigua CBS 183.55]|uniref:Uncharacterized protein n=1 Tax=Didymella exigua CBS 183.55 TaxID=1150837 RepID=A0A6A5RSP2_9PLEO|nr:uncharacterized protein M421DRAFT_385196 [Didymella exigua CBS 183.55]KAF1930124.1 hypothetical protein M421DRAFT_385196 [Didymella exigua CBS 183.55]
MANVWTQMGYVPPRGQCNFKQTIVSSRCPCLRFMLHPLKSSSSYECDGCAHHASFHSMENKADDDTRKKWEQEAKEKAEEHEHDAAERPKKRPRAIGYVKNSEGLLNYPGLGALLDGTAGKDKNAAKTKAGTSRTIRAAGSRGRGRITEFAEGEEVVVELN